MVNPIGMTLGPYRLIDQIGRGGMATVYKAYQPALDRYVALKVLPAHLTDEPGFGRRFKREAHAVAKLEHPHILPVYDYGREEELSYIAMRYVEGGTLKQLLGQPLELPLIVKLIGQIADALDHAHEHGVIHRDVKPSNVLLDQEKWALLTDFGVARIVEATEQITATGVGVGTPAYMSPEQGQGKRVDRRSDIYSLGVVLYEMLTGRVPYEADTPIGVVWKHVNEPLPLPRSINPEIPEGVERVVLKAMAKEPEDRFRSAKEIAGAVTQALGEAHLSEFAPARANARTGRALNLRRWAIPIALVAALGLILALGGPGNVDVLGAFRSLGEVLSSPADSSDIWILQLKSHRLPRHLTRYKSRIRGPRRWERMRIRLS
jgi:serine/threonine protein kinase